MRKFSRKPCKFCRRTLIYFGFLHFSAAHTQRRWTTHEINATTTLWKPLDALYSRNSSSCRRRFSPINTDGTTSSCSDRCRRRVPFWEFTVGVLHPKGLVYCRRCPPEGAKVRGFTAGVIHPRVSVKGFVVQACFHRGPYLSSIRLGCACRQSLRVRRVIRRQPSHSKHVLQGVEGEVSNLSCTREKAAASQHRKTLNASVIGAPVRCIELET